MNEVKSWSSWHNSPWQECLEAKAVRLYQSVKHSINILYKSNLVLVPCPGRHRIYGNAPVHAFTFDAGKDFRSRPCLHALLVYTGWGCRVWARRLFCKQHERWRHTVLYLPAPTRIQ